MDINNYISSGILELYVYGALSETESEEVTRKLKEYPEIRAEVEAIEKTLMDLSGAVAPGYPDFLLHSIKAKLGTKETAPGVIPIERKRTNWPAYIGWAACILVLVGLFVTFNKNQELRESLLALQAEKAQMESQIANARTDADKAEELLSVIRKKDIIRVPLDGQAQFSEAFATAYWDKKTNTTYIDAQDLPTPPRGMAYQVWSLKLEPLTPTSIGMLEEFEKDENKVFELKNTNSSEAFGITLEPEGGSESPTMEQLYTLGVVSS